MRRLSPYFLVNFKSYEETAGDDGLAFIETIERVSEATDTRFAVAPQLPDLRWIAERTSLPVVAQAAIPRSDAGMGDATIEAVADAGAAAVFVTHPGLEVGFESVGPRIARCRDLGLESIVWVSDRETARAALSFDPDCLLYERPSDIASDDGMVRTDPERIERFVEFVSDESPRTSVFVGGGVRTAEDVERAFACGVDATGAASAAVEATDREGWLRSIAAAVPD
ncbi:triose-phosphate isomerase [Natrarchaeobaculum sulfurireducens]|uniref:Triosephosphate isomerase n=1 Tax=Natrarchaeobaculum sulfurireducens TaxID=2044521 RepID=A0A346PC06_9EURY|nr:triose-phosphate isomerase [Natrarchaeobaculum sulfurireducens]AXR77051.1 Triosephosphate isomerase [Natrarchaeobaculum sulfurireducens]